MSLSDLYTDIDFSFKITHLVFENFDPSLIPPD